MTYKIVFSPHAIRDYKKLPPELKPAIREAVEALAHAPLSGPKVKPLKGRLRAYWRYRVGDYRVLYAVDTAQHIVYVDYLQHRRDVYRDAESS